MKAIETVKRLVRSAFAAGVPNGWTLGWDRARFSSELASAAAPHECLNTTSFDYSRCNRYEIRLREDAPSKRVATVLISFIVPTFSIHWTEYTLDGRVGKVIRPSGIMEEVNELIRTTLGRLGLSELREGWADEPIEGVLLELSAPAEVTLGKCLFEDYDG